MELVQIEKCLPYDKTQNNSYGTGSCSLINYTGQTEQATR